MTDPLYVINSRGETELFSFRKVYQSARRVGASRSLAQKIAKTIQKEVYSGIKTLEISKKMKRLLSQEAPRSAIKFSLRKGMRKLGPTGFPFEKYTGEILSRNGFKVKLNQYIPGFCCRYEIDFLAEKGNLIYIGECKYHNLPGGRVHLDIALSNYARFLDIKEGGFFDKKIFRTLKIKSLLVTNTKFTSKVVKYSKCMGVELLGWNYPKRKGLEYLIDSHKLYPITILPSFNQNLAKIFTSKKMMLVQDLLRIDPLKFVKKFKIPIKYLSKLIKEAKILIME